MESVESKLYFVSTPAYVDMDKALEEAGRILKGAVLDGAILPENLKASIATLKGDVEYAPKSYQRFPLVLEVSSVRKELNKAYFERGAKPLDKIEYDIPDSE